MQLTRAVLTIALAASAANALPRREPGDCANAQGRQQATLEAALNGIDKRSHISAYPRLKLGFGVGAGTGGESGLNQNTQKETMGQLESVGADEVRSSGNVQNTNRLLSNSGKGADRTVEGMMTFKLPDSTQSSAFQKKHLVQRSSSEEELHGILGMSNNADVPVLDTIAVMSQKTHIAMQTGGADQGKPSEATTGFTLNVREPISSLVQNRGCGKIFFGNLHANLMSQQSREDQRQGSNESSTAISNVENHKDMSQQGFQMPVSQLQHSTGKAVQSHTDTPAASVSYQENLAGDQKQTTGHHGEQKMQQNQQQM